MTDLHSELKELLAVNVYSVDGDGNNECVISIELKPDYHTRKVTIENHTTSYSFAYFKLVNKTNEEEIAELAVNTVEFDIHMGRERELFRDLLIENLLQKFSSTFDASITMLNYVEAIKYTSKKLSDMGLKLEYKKPR